MKTMPWSQMSNLLTSVRARSEKIPLGVSTLLGSLFAMLAISYPATWFLAPFALGAFFFDLYRARSVRSAFLMALVFGLASGGAGIWWFWGTLPLNWLGVENPIVQFYLVLASWGPITLVFALVTTVGSLVLWRARHTQFLPLIAALVWTAIEYFRMWGFSLYTYEERSLMGAHFSSSALGYPLAEQSYLLQIAEGGGVHLLNFTVALMGALIAYLLTRQTDAGVRHLRGAYVTLLILMTLLAYPLVQSPRTYSGEPLEVGLLTTDIPLVAKNRQSTQVYLDSLTSVVTTLPTVDVVILPEEISLEPSFKDAEEKRTALQSIFGDRDVLILSSNHIITDSDFTLTLSYDMTSGEHLGAYSKMFLMPGGEYMPYLMTLGFSLAPDVAFARHESSLKRRALPGKDVTAVPYKGWTIGGLICSDFLSPELYSRTATVYGANILVNLANPAWFHHSTLLYEKTRQIAKVHAVQNRAYFLQASNGSPSYAIDPEGEVIAETYDGFVGTLPVTITP